jgi:hypothetical protein
MLYATRQSAPHFWVAPDELPDNDGRGRVDYLGHD